MLQILVAEDDRGIQTLLRTILSRHGFSVECVPDGAVAIQRLAGGAPYDVLLLDLMMPNASGGDVIRWIEANRPELVTRIAVLTAAAGDELEAIRPFPLLRKPFDIDELLRTVRRLGASRPSWSCAPVLHARPHPVAARVSWMSAGHLALHGERDALVRVR